METIKIYLDNMFSGLPKTIQMSEIKNNILNNMEDKYNELKSAGKSENEAIGIVISEFGNIDELINELGIKRDAVTDDKPVITREETYTYLEAKRKMGIRIAVGVFLCIMAAASVVLLYTLFDEGLITAGHNEDVKDILSVIPLFVLVAIAVAIFIYSGMRFEKFKYIEDGIILPAGIKSEIEQKYNAFNKIYSISVTIGVCLVILSVIPLLISSVFGDAASNYGLMILLGIAAVAVVDFIYFGTIRESYSRLLRIGDYTEKKVKENKVIGAVASIVWPLAVAVFLFLGFVYDKWGIAWVIFPITGVLFGMFSAAYSTITGNK